LSPYTTLFRSRLVVRVPTRLFRKRLTETYGELLQAVLLEVGLPNTRLDFVCSEPEPLASAAPGSAAAAAKQARLDFDSIDHQLNPRYTFDTFVVGASNQFALAASLAVADSPSNAYNPLYDHTHQTTSAADCLPKENSAIEERLRSRFEWGLIADIQPPDLETKIAILQKKAETERVQLPDEVAEFIARSIKSNVRELEGALTRFVAYASLTGAGVNLATAQQVLRNIIASQEKKVTIELIQKRVGEQFGLREHDLKMRSNSKAIAFPRQIAMYLAKQLTAASLPEIGRQFGG